MIEDKLNQIQEEITKGTSFLHDVAAKLEHLTTIIESCPVNQAHRDISCQKNEVMTDEGNIALDSGELYTERL